MDHEKIATFSSCRQPIKLCTIKLANKGYEFDNGTNKIRCSCCDFTQSLDDPTLSIAAIETRHNNRTSRCIRNNVQRDSAFGIGRPVQAEPVIQTDSLDRSRRDQNKSQPERRPQSPQAGREAYRSQAPDPTGPTPQTSTARTVDTPSCRSQNPSHTDRTQSPEARREACRSYFSSSFTGEQLQPQPQLSLIDSESLIRAESSLSVTPLPAIVLRPLRESRLVLHNSGLERYPPEYDSL